ncbi:MAG: hypothetical protein JNJ83_09915 [Verrucomicrobiaceae bacterium]|nr:hypothetical protein [Verrucomicrobiaceae bacterium]
MYLLSQVQSSALDALLIGGHAVISYGVPRSTFDLDLLVRKEQRESWRTFMTSRGYTLFHESDPFQQWTPPTGEIAVDFMLVDEPTWDKMRASAQIVQLGSLPCLAVAPIHLVALKLHAMKFRPGSTADKDWRDIVELVRACNLDPASPELLAIVRRYANASTLTRYATHFHVQL